MTDPESVEPSSTGNRSVSREKRFEERLDERLPKTHWALNVLIVGPPDGVERLLAAVTPDLRPPVHRWSPGAALPPPADVGTLLIRNLETLDADEQRELSSWLKSPASSRVRVVSTSTGPLLPRVREGTFMEVLYYRLNTLTLRTRSATDEASRQLAGTPPER